MKKKPENNNSHPEDQKNVTENDKTQNPGITTYDNSAIYIYNKETGEWEVRNPAGSVGYNYLYRDEIDI